MVVDSVLAVAGLVLLTVAANQLVLGSSRLATRLRIGPVDSDNPAWTAEDTAGNYSRVLHSLSGYAGVRNTAGTATYQLANLHGDLIATVAQGGGAGLSATHEQTETGTPQQR